MFTRANLTQLIADLANKPTLNADQLKAYFDHSPIELKDAINLLEQELEGSTAASQIGATPLNEFSGSNIQSILQYLKGQIDNVALGTIPDGSITEVKLAFNVATQEELDKTHEALERNSYDDYALWLELYYKGTLGQIEASSTKALTFDGFQDRVNISSANALVDTTSKLVKGGDTNGSAVAYNIYDAMGTYDTGTVEKGWEYTLDKPISKLGKTSMKIGLNSNVNGNVKLYKNGTLLQTISKTVYVGNGEIVVDWSAYNISFVTGDKIKMTFTSIDNTFTILMKDVGSNANPYFYAYGSALNYRYSPYFAIYYVGYEITNLETTNKALSFTPTKVKLYQSIKTNNGSVIPQFSYDNGVTWANGTKISERADTKFTGYTEEEWEFSSNGTNGKMKFTLNPSADKTTVPELKRYGLHYL